MTDAEHSRAETPSAGLATLELWADPGAIRRGRALATFLLLNWIAMGYLVLANGLRSMTGAVAFAFGLLTLVGGLSQLRGVRLARQLPLVRLSANSLEYRYYTGRELRSEELASFSRIASAARDRIVLARPDGTELAVPCLALDPRDRDRFEAALRARLERDD